MNMKTNSKLRKFKKQAFFNKKRVVVDLYTGAVMFSVMISTKTNL